MDDESSGASHKEVTTETEELLTTENRRKDFARHAHNQTTARSNTDCRSEDGLFNMRNPRDQKQTHSPVCVILKSIPLVQLITTTHA